MQRYLILLNIVDSKILNLLCLITLFKEGNIKKLFHLRNDLHFFFQWQLILKSFEKIFLNYLNASFSSSSSRAKGNNI